MNTRTRLTLCSKDLDQQGNIKLGYTLGSDCLTFEFYGNNGVYNIPQDTTFVFNDSELSIPAGSYSANNLKTFMENMLKLVTVDATVTIDQYLNKFIIGTGSPTGTFDTTNSSYHFCNMIGFPAGLYTGISLQAPNCYNLVTGPGLWFDIQGLRPKNVYESKSLSVPIGSIFVPWSEFGGPMITYDRNFPKIFKTYNNSDIGTLNVKWRDISGYQPSFNGVDFCIFISIN